MLTSVTAEKSCRFVEKEANTKLALKKSSLRRKGLMTMGNCDVPLRWEALGERMMNHTRQRTACWVEKNEAWREALGESWL